MSKGKQTPDPAANDERLGEGRYYKNAEDKLGINPSIIDRWVGYILKHCEEHGLPEPKTDGEWDFAIERFRTLEVIRRSKGRPEKLGPWQLAVLQVEYQRLIARPMTQMAALEELAKRPPWYELLPGARGDEYAVEALLNHVKKESPDISNEFKFVEQEGRTLKWDELLAEGNWEGLETLMEDTKSTSTLNALASALKRLPPDQS